MLRLLVLLWFACHVLRPTELDASLLMLLVHPTLRLLVEMSVLSVRDIFWGLLVLGLFKGNMCLYHLAHLLVTLELLLSNLKCWLHLHFL